MSGRNQKKSIYFITYKEEQTDIKNNNEKQIAKQNKEENNSIDENHKTVIEVNEIINKKDGEMIGCKNNETNNYPILPQKNNKEIIYGKLYIHLIIN